MRFPDGWPAHLPSSSPAQLTTQGVSIVPCGVTTAFTFFTPRSSVRTWMPVTGQFSITWSIEDHMELFTCTCSSIYTINMSYIWFLTLQRHSKQNICWQFSPNISYYQTNVTRTLLCRWCIKDCIFESHCLSYSSCVVSYYGEPAKK